MVEDAKKNTLDSKEIQCPICGCKFRPGMIHRTCQQCVFHAGNCSWEKCPNCGFDIARTSKIWEFLVKIKNKITGVIEYVWRNYSR